MRKLLGLFAAGCAVVLFPLGVRAADVQGQPDKPNAPADVQSLLPNGGFEVTGATGIPDGWVRWPADAPAAMFTTTDENPAGGKLCLKYDLTAFKYTPELSGKYMDRGREYVDQTGPSFAVDLAKATRYRFSYWYKADKSDKPAVYLYFAVYGKDNVVFDYRGHEPMGTGKWEKASTEITLAPGSTAVRIGIRGYLGTKVYLDDVMLEPITEAGI